MPYRDGFEVLNNILKDLRDNTGIVGGVTVLLAGDFWKILPVVPRGSRADEVKACMKSSYFWSLVHKIYLKKEHESSFERRGIFFAQLLCRR